MKDILTIEKNRQKVQLSIDSQKTPKDRNILGQFATPPSLALEIARYARHLWGTRGPVNFLDPAIGTGSFYAAMRQVFSPDLVSSASGIEIDPTFVETAHDLWAHTGLDIREGDFTHLIPQRNFNLVLTNPPYVRHHHLDREDKVRLQTRTHALHGIHPSGLSGLYCYFMYLTHAWMTRNALAVWLIPSEFMEVNYGKELKRYLIERVTLLRIHRFDPNNVQFDDALVTSAVVVFANCPPHSEHTTTFSFGGSLLDPERSEDVALTDLRQVRKWTALSHRHKPTSDAVIRLGDLFHIKRGIATGANAFFVMPRDEAMRIGVPAIALKPILPSPRFLTTTVIDADEDGWPILVQPLALIDCDLPSHTIEESHPLFWSYLDSGVKKGIDRGYLTSRRTPWYGQEQRDPAPFLCTYMGRYGKNTQPFRFIWNRSKAITTNVYLMLYPKPEMQRALDRNDSVADSVFEALHSIDIDHLVCEGRVYGGGLHKIEPKELANLPACKIAEAAGLHDQKEQMTFLYSP